MPDTMTAPIYWATCADLEFEPHLSRRPLTAEEIVRAAGAYVNGETNE